MEINESGKPEICPKCKRKKKEAVQQQRTKGTFCPFTRESCVFFDEIQEAIENKAKKITIYPTETQKQIIIKPPKNKITIVKNNNNQSCE